MNDHILNFNQRLLGVFEKKAEEFTRYSQEESASAIVAAQIAGLYSELADLVKQ
ncbi:MAG: hypothetical protein IAF58_01130 [Leptolyngbya sp.]|nr:hypothetical protein [Candidatus Melainabacteria bacterium]